MVLQHERTGLADARFSRSGRLAFDGHMVLHEHAIVQDGKGGGSCDLT